MTCPSCASEVREASRFCSTCGASFGDGSIAPTRTSLRDRAPPRVARRRALHPRDSSRARYRILGLLGKGGWEVTRADDFEARQKKKAGVSRR